MFIKIKKLTPTAQVPVSTTEGAAGKDLYADIPEKIWIKPGETKLIGTGIAIELPPGVFGGIYSRSGLAIKEGLRVANGVGVVDWDYRGEVKVGLYNDSNVSRVVEPQQRIAQLIVQPYIGYGWDVVTELNNTNRGNGSFGHSGK